MSDGNAWAISFYVIVSIAIVISLLLYLRWYIIRPMYRGNSRMEGKTVVITGANTGIGKETALDMAKRGAKVIILCRNMEKGEAAANEINQVTNIAVEVYPLDLSSLNSVRSCAETMKEKVPKIDVLINNAGVMTCPQWQTEEGFEMQLGTNHLGHFLLTLLLIDNLKVASPSRVVIVSSLGHIQGKMHWNDLHLRENYDPMKAYTQSKLANILFTRSLGQKLQGTGVNCYALHPGVVRTELARHLGWSAVFFKMFGLFLKTPKQGAQTSIYCAVEPSLDQETGKYYSGCAAKKPSSRARNNEDAERLWRWSLHEVGLDSSFTI